MVLVHVQMLKSSWSILNECDECKLTSEKNIVFPEKTMSNSKGIFYTVSSKLFT